VGELNELVRGGLECVNNIMGARARALSLSINTDCGNTEKVMMTYFHLVSGAWIFK